MADLYFEGRSLQLYGEYVLTADLVAGRVYFKLSFLDEDMVVPEMYALVFIGKDLRSQLPGLYFQDAESYFDGLRLKNDDYVPSYEGEELPDGSRWGGDDHQFEWHKEKKYSGVFEFEGALNSLLACSLRRRRWGGTIRRPGGENENSKQ